MTSRQQFVRPEGAPTGWHLSEGRQLALAVSLSVCLALAVTHLRTQVDPHASAPHKLHLPTFPSDQTTSQLSVPFAATPTTPTSAAIPSQTATAPAAGNLHVETPRAPSALSSGGGTSSRPLLALVPAAEGRLPRTDQRQEQVGEEAEGQAAKAAAEVTTGPSSQAASPGGAPRSAADQAPVSVASSPVGSGGGGGPASGGSVGVGRVGGAAPVSSVRPRTVAPPGSGGLPRLPLFPPLAIAHRGASAELPEHTREAYELAVAEGAAFIECDVVLTSDLVPLCRHEPNLATSTDAPTKFPDRWRTATIDGQPVRGIFSTDLTAAEVATLRAVQPWPFRNQSYNGVFRVATLEDYLTVAVSANRSVGIYPETKHPSWTNALPALTAAHTTLEDILLAALARYGFTAPYGSAGWRARPVFVQSFEAVSLRYVAARSCVPLVLLLGDWEGWTAPDSNLTLAQLTTPASLAEISTWAAAVGPSKATLVTWQPQQPQQQPAGPQRARVQQEVGPRQQQRDSGAADDSSLPGPAPQPVPAPGAADSGRCASSGLVERFHEHGLQVHTYTLRPEPQFFLPHLAESAGLTPESVNVSAEYSLLLGGVVAVDGLFTDYLPSLAAWMQGGQGARQQQQLMLLRKKVWGSGGGGWRGGARAGRRGRAELGQPTGRRSERLGEERREVEGAEAGVEARRGAMEEAGEGEVGNGGAGLAGGGRSLGSGVVGSRVWNETLRCAVYRPAAQLKPRDLAVGSVGPAQQSGPN